MGARVRPLRSVYVGAYVLHVRVVRAGARAGRLSSPSHLVRSVFSGVLFVLLARF